MLHGLRRLVFDQVSERDAWQALDARPAGCLAPESGGGRREPGGGATKCLQRCPPSIGRGVRRFRFVSCKRVSLRDTLGKNVKNAQLAVQVGSPRAARAVGSVMANNRELLLVIPCHRNLSVAGVLWGASLRGPVCV